MTAREIRATEGSTDPFLSPVLTAYCAGIGTLVGLDKLINGGTWGGLIDLCLAGLLLAHSIVFYRSARTGRGAP